MIVVTAAFIIEAILFYLLKNFVDQGILIVLTITINAFVFFFIFSRKTKSKAFLVILITAYLLRLGFLIFDVYGSSIFILPNSGADTVAYHNLATATINGAYDFLSAPRGNYTVFLAVVYKIFGISKIMGQYVNLIFGMFTPLVFLKIIHYMKLDEKKTVLPFAVVCFFPQFLIFSAILLRESIMIFFIALSVYYFIKWYKEGKLISLAGAVLSILLASVFHFALITIAIAYVLVFSLYSTKKKRIGLSLKTFVIIGGGALGLLVLFIFFRQVFFAKLWYIESGNYEYIVRAVSFNWGDSAYLSNLEYNTFGDVFLYAIPRTIFFIFSPMPWDWRGFMDGFSFVFDSAFYLFFIFGSVSMYKRTNKDDRVLFIALYGAFLMFSILYAQGTFTAGTAVRHRSNVIFLLITAFILSAKGNSPVFEKTKIWLKEKKNILKLRKK